VNADNRAIGQDADAVMFVYRDEYYMAQLSPKQMAYGSEEKITRR
jgi:replicative DNA helicase